MARRSQGFVSPSRVSPAESEEAEVFVSKSQRKRDMHEIQALGEALVGLNASRLKSLDLPERLFDAVVAAQSMTRHEARRRQVQFIGRLMRGIDPEPVRALLAAQAAVPVAGKAKMALLEDWRRRLLEEPVSALSALETVFPEVFSDEVREAWRQRIAQAQQERHQQQTPPRHYRQLFQDLKSLFETHSKDASPNPSNFSKPLSS